MKSRNKLFSYIWIKIPEPLLTSLEIIFAVGTSHTSDNAIKSPNEDILSAPVSESQGIYCIKKNPCDQIHYFLSDPFQVHKHVGVCHVPAQLCYLDVGILYDVETKAYLITQS